VFVLMIVHVVACAGVIVACGEKLVWAEKQQNEQHL